MPTRPKPLTFGLSKIETLQFAMLGDGKAAGGELRQQSEFSFGAILENRIIGCICKFILNRNDEPFALIEVACHFFLEENSWKELLDKNRLVLPVEFARHIATVTLGAARGIFHEKTVNTPFNTYLIPLQNLTELFNEDAVIDLDIENQG